MGELGSDFSLGGEKGIKREEEKETSTKLCSWARQPTLRWQWQHFFTHSLPPWIICVVFLDCLDGIFQGERDSHHWGKSKSVSWHWVRRKRRGRGGGGTDSGKFSPHLCLCRRFFCGRMGAGALTICVSRSYKGLGWLKVFPFNLWLRAKECITGLCCSEPVHTFFYDVLVDTGWLVKCQAGTNLFSLWCN